MWQGGAVDVGAKVNDAAAEPAVVFARNLSRSAVVPLHP